MQKPQKEEHSQSPKIVFQDYRWMKSFVAKEASFIRYQMIFFYVNSVFLTILHKSLALYSIFLNQL